MEKGGVLVPGERPDQIHSIHDDASSAVVHDSVAVHVTAFAVGRRRGQALDNSNGQRLNPLLPARGKSSGTGVLLLQAGRQSADRVIATEKEPIFGAEIAAIAVLIRVVAVLIVVAAAFVLAVVVMIVVIVIETGKGVRYGGKREGAYEKQPPIHGVNADRGMWWQMRTSMHGWTAWDNRKDSPHRQLVGENPLFSPGESRMEQVPQGEKLGNLLKPGS